MRGLSSTRVRRVLCACAYSQSGEDLEDDRHHVRALLDIRNQSDDRAVLLDLQVGDLDQILKHAAEALIKDVVRA